APRRRVVTQAAIKEARGMMTNEPTANARVEMCGMSPRRNVQPTAAATSDRLRNTLAPAWRATLRASQCTTGAAQASGENGRRAQRSVGHSLTLLILGRPPQEARGQMTRKCSARRLRATPLPSLGTFCFFPLGLGWSWGADPWRTRARRSLNQG